MKIYEEVLRKTNSGLEIFIYDSTLKSGLNLN